MAVISRDKGVIAGAAQPLIQSIAPVNGTNSVQTITLGGTPTGGTFTLSIYGYTTAAIAWSATNATLVANIDAALEGLPPVGTGGVTTAVGTMTAGIGTITCTFDGATLAKTAVPAMSVGTNSLTGTSPTVAVANTTPGVAATHRNAPTGLLLSAGDTGIAYENKGVPGAPTWTQIGA